LQEKVTSLQVESTVYKFILYKVGTKKIYLSRVTKYRSTSLLDNTDAFHHIC